MDPIQNFNMSYQLNIQRLLGLHPPTDIICHKIAISKK